MIYDSAMDSGAVPGRSQMKQLSEVRQDAGISHYRSCQAVSGRWGGWASGWHIGLRCSCLVVTQICLQPTLGPHACFFPHEAGRCHPEPPWMVWRLAGQSVQRETGLICWSPSCLDNLCLSRASSLQINFLVLIESCPLVEYFRR